MLKMLATLLILLFVINCIVGLPVSSLHDPKGIQAGTECNDIDEVVSSDPCQPFCTCTDGKVFCAELYCSKDNLPVGQTCRKVPTNGKCCPSYLCMNENGTGELHYPLPQLFLPPELGLSGPYVSKHDAKAAPKEEEEQKYKLKSFRI